MVQFIRLSHIHDAAKRLIVNVDHIVTIDGDEDGAIITLTRDDMIAGEPVFRVVETPDEVLALLAERGTSVV